MPSSAKHEVWVYDRVNAARKKITDTAGADPCSASSYRPTITSLLQDYWGATGSDDDRTNTSGYDLSVAGASGMSSSCPFLAAAGVLPAANFIEPLVPSISKDGRFVAFVTDFDAETVARVTDDAAGVGPVATHNAFLYDRVLGATTRLTRMPASAVAGQASCCPAASSSYKTGSCSHKNRLLGRCCEQKPCRMGALNAEVSGDGQKVAFLAEVAYGGTSVNSPDGDTELFIHHVPTDTTHRISHTFDKDWDETFPHLNHDGTVIVWESKSHYGAEINADSDGNKDVWMTRLTYGCDDPDAHNYKMDADIAECCHYVDATIGGGATSEVSLTLQVDLADALNRTLNTPADDSCAAWRDAVLSDLACALRVPANLITSSTAGTCAALSADAGAKTIAVSVTFHPGASGPTATELQNKLVTALKDARSQVWSGVATRYTLKAIAASDSSILFTRDSTDDAYEYIRGTTVRVSIGAGSGSTRSSSTARVSGDGAYIVYESESDELGLGITDGTYHIYRMEVATGTKVLVTPVDQASSHDSKYPSSSADGKTICYYSNAPSSHAKQCYDCGREYQWWVAKANDANTGFGTPTPISWSSTDGRKATSNGRCQVSDDGSAIVFSTDSDLSAPLPRTPPPPAVLSPPPPPVSPLTTLLHETFDTPDGFTRTNLIGPVPFFNDPDGDYFGINKGDGASYFSCPSALSHPTYGAASCPDTTWIGTDNAPAVTPAYTGFTGAYLESARVHGGGHDPDGTSMFLASPFILTWTKSGSCSGTLVFSGTFANRRINDEGMESDDFIRVQASVDGAAPVTVLEFRGNPNDRLAVDTDLDGIGDGVALDLAAARFTANIPGMMTSSVVLTVSLRTTAHNEQLALDDIQLLCGPLYDSPPAPPSPPTVTRHAYARHWHAQSAPLAAHVPPRPHVAHDTHAHTSCKHTQAGETKRRTLT